mgnify:CR=1 FL=1
MRLNGFLRPVPVFLQGTVDLDRLLDHGGLDVLRLHGFLDHIQSFIDRVLRLVAEVAAAPNTRAQTSSSGKFGVLPSAYATPLALALTELVTNAVEHGLAGLEGRVEIITERDDERLRVRVRDTGAGLPEGEVGRGLGTQIVRTLIQGELGGTIDWHSLAGEETGTEVTIEIPLRWIQRDT